MNITTDTHVVLWSPRQKSFHIETFHRMLYTNLRIFDEQSLGDYIILALTGSRDEANKAIDKMQEHLRTAASV